ncbi:peptidoglycan endopeptidase [Clostridiaceae bacterium]|nr:C40 family peptidase [Lachnospiraceae bacterium]NBH15985.1 peptidoglycan endopeptidase [Clostridiaceae bacterium]
MRKIGLYIAAMMTTGAVLWGTPILSYAEPIMVEANNLVSEDEMDEEDPEDIEDPSMAGPGIEARKQEEARVKAFAEAEAAKSAEKQAADARQNLVNYALQFVGGPYRAGGNDPHTGADCSGFVKYVMENGAGISMNRSSSSQSTQGTPVSASQMQPGDLIFYGNGSRINHVALYIGNGQIVHASTYKTGIKISNWNYRTPVKITSVFPR